MNLKGFCIKSLLVASAIFTTQVPALAATVDLKVKLDSTTVMMGRVVNMRVDLNQHKNQKGEFPLLMQAAKNGWIGVCGDSVEYKAPSRIDTVVAGDRLKISFSIPVQSFDSGYYKLPPLAYAVGGDTVLSNTVALKIVPVNVGANDPINDYANVSEPEDKSIFDILPDWLVDFWWLVLLVLAAASGGIWLWKKYKKKGYIIPPKPQPTPYEIAHMALLELKGEKLWEQGLEKDYFTKLTDILRTYLYSRFGINAMEMTSRQILSAMSKNELTNALRGEMRQILNMADFVKFAKVRPLAEDNVQAFDNALKIVEDTKPVVVQDESASLSEEVSKQKKGGKS